MRLAAVAVVAAAWLLAVAPAPAQQRPQGDPDTGQVVRDPEFGVSARHFGLERRVEMLQWLPRDGGYAKQWSAEVVDSGSFPERYRNPGALPLPSRRWIARVMLDGHPVSAAAIDALGVWRPFRPSFSALPGNLAATFQPEGDGLGSAENPLDPQVGDLRIHWRELELPPLQDRVLLRGGEWVPVPGAAAGGDPDDPEPGERSFAWLAGAGALALVLVFVARVGRRRR
jgi:hypothetical protein